MTSHGQVFSSLEIVPDEKLQVVIHADISRKVRWLMPTRRSKCWLELTRCKYPSYCEISAVREHHERHHPTPAARRHRMRCIQMGHFKQGRARKGKGVVTPCRLHYLGANLQIASAFTLVTSHPHDDLPCQRIKEGTRNRISRMILIRPTTDVK